MSKAAIKKSSLPARKNSSAELPKEPVNRSGNLLLVTVLVLATMALVPLAFAAHTIRYFDWDLAISHAVQGITVPGFDGLMLLIGAPGYPPQVYLLVVVILAALWRARLKWETVCEAFAIVGIGVVGLAVKIAVDRPRPDPNLIHVATPGLDGGKLSFTAGHVESYVAILGFLFFLAYISRDHSPWRTLELIVFGLMIALIGLARIYSGEHWPSDVLGGYLLGAIWLALTIRLYEWGKPRFFRK